MKKEYYTSIDELPVRRYNKIAESGDLSYLRFDKQKGDESILQVYWSKIVNEYVAATSHREGNRDVYRMQHSIFELTTEFNNINALCFVLKNAIQLNQPDLISKAVERLNNYGHEAYTAKDADRVEQQNRNLLTQRREVELQMATKLSTKGEDITFEQLVSRISKHMGIWLNTDTITCKEWIGIEDDYIKDMNHGRNNQASGH